MTTYKVLLVDDEEEVRNAIEQRINWEELGFEVIGKAQNGVKSYGNSRKTAARCGHYRYQNAIYEWIGTGT